MSRSSPDITALADEIEKSDGIYLMHSGKEIPRGYQLGTRKTAEVIAALRASQPATPTGGSTIDDVPSCGQENDYRRARSSAGIGDVFVSDQDREYARDLLDDLGEEGITNQEIVAQWLCKVRVEASRTAAKPSADINAVAVAIEETMFAPHGLPVDAELHSKYRGTAIAAIKAMNRTPHEAATPLGPCTQAELDAFEGLDSKSRQLFSKWVDRALRAEKELSEINGKLFASIPGVAQPSRPAAFLAWAVDMFGPTAGLRSERLLRFVEEAIELAHADGMGREVFNRLADRVYSRPAGETLREIGQAQACLEMFAEQIGLSSADEAQREWERVQNIPRSEWERRHAAKAASGITMSSTDRNWAEDSPHENGNYECSCAECGHSFIGHKRRVLCKLCSNLLTPSITPPESK